MEEGVSVILDQLFSRSVDQRTIRNLKKTIEDLQPSAQSLLVSEVVQKLGQCLKDDSVAALSYVCLFSSGCQLLQQCVTDSLPDIINSCISGMQPDVMENDTSRFHISSKAVYGVLQIISTKYDTPLENHPPTFLHQLLELLIFAVADENLPSDCALITGTSLCLAFTMLVEENRPRKFYELLKIIESYNGYHDKEMARVSLAKLLTVWDDEICLSVGEFEISFPIVITVHGLLNCGASWLYSVENCSLADELLKANAEGCQKHSSEECARDSKTGHQSIRRCGNEDASLKEDTHSEISPGMKCSEGSIKGDKDCERGNVFLYCLGLLINKICRVPSSYSFQAFQALLSWLQNVRKMIRRYKEDYGHQKLHDSCIVSPSKLVLFAFHSENASSVFHLLNSNWENPSKGVSDTVYSCMMELLHLREEESPGQAKTLSLQMISNLVSVDAWNLKSTYPPLALAMSFVGAEIVLQKYPSIPEGLYKSLMVNYLAPAGTNVYKIIVNDVTSSSWSKYFLEVIMKALQSSDRVTRQNVLTLWLPITIRQYPDVCATMLDKCVRSSSEGWLARVAVLKVARACGSMDIEENMELCISAKEENEETFFEDMSNKGKKCDVEAKPFSLVVRCAINHIDEMVRSEALAFLCHTKKASQPVTQFESELLKEFFSLNINIDSAPFRQNVIRCYKALVVRLRDSCAAVLKAPPYKNVPIKKFANLDFKNLPVNSTLYINGELLLWFLSKFHSNLLPGSNYQRRILSLQLYKETLLAFFEAEKGSAFTVSPRFTSVCSFLNLLSKIVQIDTNDASKCVMDLALTWTYESLVLCSLDEMDDIRDEVENIFRILEYSKMKPQQEEVGKWLLLGLSLCNSPKTSDVESGASIVKIMSSHHDLNIPSFLEEYGGFEKPGNFLSFLYNRVEIQFRGAQNNIMMAAREAPIHGSLLALGRCLCETDGSRIVESTEYLQKLLRKLLELMVEMIEFMLSVLAISSKNGSAIAPSFAEMGESIEMMIRKCENNTEGAVQEATEAVGSELVPDSSGEDGDEVYESETAISSDHALILACCWQTMKVCCLVSSNSTSRWTEVLTEDQIETILRSVIIRVLTGTRHKGAMEAARTCYSQLCVLLLSPNSKLGHLIYRQIDDILDHLKAGAQTSVTRRAAGMAMMVQVACGAAPRNNRVLIDSTVTRLMDIIETEYEEQNTVDSPPVLALHILHSLVIHASLAHHLIQHMPNITMTCLKAFTCNSWALRNAALQLYGAVVPRMVGQKKVRDDSSMLNSLTASEFLGRHGALADFLLQLLENNENIRKSQKSQDISVKDPENNLDSNKTFSPSLADHSNLVPVLSLLARLSPGTGLQQSLELKERLSKYYNVTILLLGSQIHTVRRLSALSLVALTPSEQAVVMVRRMISSLTHERLSANEVHGKLLTIIEFLDTYPNLATDDNVRVPVISLAIMILKSASAYYIIANTALKILETLKVQNLDFNLDPTNVCKPGAPQFVLTATKLKIIQLSEEEKEKCVLEIILCNQALEEYYLTFLEGFIENSKSEKWMERVEMTIWQKLEDSEILKSVLVRILYVILKKQSRITQIPSEKCMENLLILLQGFSGAKIASKVLTVIAFVIKDLCNLKQFDSVVMCKVINEFSSVVCKYSNPTSTEDYRTEASTALTIAFPPLFLSQCCTGISPKEQLIVAVLDLLQDEDPVIRDASCHIVFHLQKYSLPYLISLNPLTFLKNQIVQELVHPNLALGYFLEIVILCSLYQNNWKGLQAIWRLVLYEDIACEYKPKLSLFQSQAVNLYKEQKHFGTKIREAFEEIVREYVASRNMQNDQPPANDGISGWVLVEYEEIKKQRKELQNSVKKHEDWLTDRRFLLAEVMCIKAQETLLSVSNILDIKLDVEFGCSLPIQEGKHFWLKL